MKMNKYFVFLVFSLGCYCEISDTILALKNNYEKEKINRLLDPTKKIIHTLTPKKKGFIANGDKFIATRKREIFSTEDIFNIKNFLEHCYNKNIDTHDYLIRNLSSMKAVSSNWGAHIEKLEDYKKIFTSSKSTAEKISETFQIVSKINKEHPIQIAKTKGQNGNLSKLIEIRKEREKSSDENAKQFHEEFMAFKNKVTAKFSKKYEEMGNSPEKTQEALTGEQFTGMLSEQWYKKFASSNTNSTPTCILALLSTLFPKQETFKALAEDPENTYRIFSYPDSAQDFRHILQLEKDIPNITQFYSKICDKSPYWKAIIDNLNTLKNIYTEETEGNIHHYNKGQTTEFLLQEIIKELNEQKVTDPSIDPDKQEFWNKLYGKG